MKHEKGFLPRWMVIGLVLTLLTAIAGGTWFYRAQEKTLRQQAAANLEAIAQLKTDQIVAWRNERLSNGAVLMGRAFLAERIAQWMGYASEDTRQALLADFRVLQGQYHYADILLTDPAGQVRLSLTGHGETHAAYMAALAEAIRERKPVLTELHTDERYPNPHISTVAPLYAGHGKPPGPVGAIILVYDAERFLYPLIQSWPLPNHSAETLLVRREGDNVLFLNELRHQKDTALKLRLPQGQADLPAARAIRGEQGVVQGRDYRGVEVVAVLKPIPDSAWFMVSKMDAAEVYAAWRLNAALILLVLTGTVGLIVGLGLVLWQRERKNHYQARYRSEAALRSAAERHSITLKAIGDAVIATDALGRVELLNPVAESLTGWRAAEARGRSIAEVFRIVDEVTGDEVESPVARVMREGRVVGLANHTLLIARDGVRRPIADSGAPIRDEQGAVTGAVLVFRDQSEERRAQRLIQKRIELIEYADHHPLEAFLTKALDEICALVESPIGFYHFVEADQKNLSLQQWSTRTRNEFCRAEGQGLHYPIDQAGVWVECVQARKPVIHNDYEALPHKKGLPEGHAPVVRELVVPVMRRDKVMSILGVGNKAVDYTEKDADAVAFLADMTWEVVKRERARQSLEESEKRYRRLFESAKDGILILDSDTGAVMDANPYLLALLGWPRQALLGKRLWELAPFKNIAGSQAAFHTLQANDFVRFEDLPLATADGRQIEAVFVSNAYAVDQKRVIQCNIRDISARKQAERALRESEQKFRMLVENSRDILYTLDAEGRFLFVSPAAHFILGYETEALVGRLYREIIHPDDVAACEEAIRRLVQASEPTPGFEYRVRHANGEWRWHTATGGPVRDPDGHFLHFQGLARDVTQIHRLEEQLRQSQKMESVGRLAGGVAHDFNNMLSVIQGYAELSLARTAPGDPLHAHLQEIFNAALRSSEITRQLLAFARRQTIAPRMLDLNATVEGMLKMLRRLIGEDIDLAWLPGTGLQTVRMDPSQLNQILANLCVNARDAIHDTGKITIETKNTRFDEAYCAQHAGFLPGEYVQLAVSDNGCGMDKATLAHLFEPFFTTKGVGKGTGLGLATIYGIVKQNDGFINVYSEPGQGSTFRIYLPAQEGQVVDGSQEKAAAMPRGQGETVLVVEDEEAILTLAQTILEMEGYRALGACDPNEAIALAGRHEGAIHLLITDVVMPGMNGRELAERLRTIHPSLKCLFMSGYTANAIAHHGVLDAGVRFLQKPFSNHDFVHKVREALDGT